MRYATEGGGNQENELGLGLLSSWPDHSYAQPTPLIGN